MQGFRKLLAVTLLTSLALGTLLAGVVSSEEGFKSGYVESDFTAYFSKLAKLKDFDSDGISDSLENMLKYSGGYVKVLVTYSLKPALGDLRRASELSEFMESILRGVREAVKGLRVTGGPWVHAVVGFSAEVPVSDFTRFTKVLRNYSSGGGVSFFVEEDGQLYALNYWSGRQLNVRQGVWSELGVTGEGTTVLIVDTGMDPTHPGIEGKLVYWVDYISGQPNPYDDHGHGTHVGGCAAGKYEGLDPEGRHVFQVSGDLRDSGEWVYLWRTSHIVNSTGTLEVEVIWGGSELSKVGIAKCSLTPPYPLNCEVVANTTATGEGTLHSVEYAINSPSEFGRYAVALYREANVSGYTYFTVYVHYPVSNVGPTPYSSGTAPEASLGAAKVLSSSGAGSWSDLISAIDDAIASRKSVDPPIYVINFSLGGAYSTSVSVATTSAVAAGMVVVAAAGNSGPGDNYAGGTSPASNPYAITVAAADIQGNVTWYSSQGGPSADDPNVTKPDVVAPGGGLLQGVFSADSNHQDYLWGDLYVYDSAAMLGTSMASPHIAGLAALVVDALVNHAGLEWDWGSPSTSLLVKNLILLCSTETYPLTRELYPSGAPSPALNKGGKDRHEGYGIPDAYCSVSLALSLGSNESNLGKVFTGSFRDGVLYGDSPEDFRTPWGSSAWGIKVTLPYSTVKDPMGGEYPVKYVFRLLLNTSDKLSTDFDLYLYSTHGDEYGEPVILASSTSGFGADEEIVFTPPSDNFTAFLVVKRAREDSAGGQWVLITGPEVEVMSVVTNGSKAGREVWLGYPVEVRAYSVAGASKAVIKIWDVTAGVLLHEGEAELRDRGVVKELEYEWVVPHDPSLAGHELEVITYFLSDSGDLIEGPYVEEGIVVREAPEPVPEAGVVGLVAVFTALLTTLYLLRRRD